MSYHGELLKNEIKLAEDECCIVFDFGCYFPYANPEVLKFEFSLGMEEYNDFKLNHRYPNKNYQTISKKDGRKLSKLGYPVVMKLKEQEQPMLLALRVGIQDNEHITLFFGLQTNMTNEKPVCALSLHFNFDEQRFYFESFEASENGIKLQRWFSHEREDGMPVLGNDIMLRTPERIEDTYTAVYQDMITPFASSLEDICVSAII